MGIRYLDEAGQTQNSASKIRYLDPEPTVGGMFGKVPVSEYQAGKRNILGNIFDRPSAAVRSGLLGRNPVSGFKNPTDVPRLQDLALDAYYRNERPEDVFKPGSMAAGFLVSGAGLLADIAVDPTTYALSGAGKLAKPLAESIALTKPGQAIQKVSNTPISKLLPNRSVASDVDTAISKAIRPSVVGKSTATQAAKYNFRAREAVDAIYRNKSNLQFMDDAGQAVNKLPESLKDFSTAIEQTKGSIFTQYDTLAKEAGEKGASVNLSNIANEVEKGVSNKAIQTLYPKVREYALEKAAALRQAGSFSPEDAQGAIKMLNNSLDAFYKNPTPETASRAVIDAGIVNNLRKALDETITASTGSAYQPLKRQYASLLAIEKDVNRRAIVHARQNAKGLIDFTDIFAGSDIAEGILTMSPSRLAVGATKIGIKNYIKAINNPDNIVRGMFRSVDKAARKGRLNDLIRKSSTSSPKEAIEVLIPELVDEMASARKNLSDIKYPTALQHKMAGRLPPYRSPTTNLGVMVPEEQLQRRIARPKPPMRLLGFQGNRETKNLGVMLKPDAHERIGEITEQLSSLSRALNILRRRADNFGDARLRTEVRLIEKQLEGLLIEQGGIYKKLNESRRLKSASEIASHG